jgi:hypothetical protein
MVHVMNWSRVLGTISNGVLDTSDTKAIIRRMVAYAAAGFHAPATDSVQRRRGSSKSTKEPTHA